MELFNSFHNQINNPEKKVKISRKGNRHKEGYFHSYYQDNKEKIKERARQYSKEHYVPRPKKALTPYMGKRDQKVLEVFGSNKNVFLERQTRDKGRKEKWKGILSNYKNASEILKKGKNWIIRMGIENSYRNKYMFGCFDADGRLTSHIGTENNSIYMKTPRGNHFIFLFKKKVLNKNTKLKIQVGVKRKEVSVDFIINSYILGAGSWREENGKILPYEIKGRGYNFFIGIFETDLEALNWFVEKYQAKIISQKAQRRVERLNNQFDLQAQIEQQPLNWNHYRHIWAEQFKIK